VFGPRNSGFENFLKSVVIMLLNRDRICYKIWGTHTLCML